MADVFEQLGVGLANSQKQRRLDIVLAHATKSGMSSRDLMILAAKNKVTDDPNFIAMYKQLTADEAAKQAQQQDAEFNMKAGTSLNKEIGGYLKENPSASPMQSLQSGAIKNDTIPTPQGASSFALGSDSFNQNLSNFAKQLQGESSLSGIPTEQSGALGQQPTSQLKPVADTETAYNGIMKGIPVDIAQDLIFKYHNGLVKPKDFLKEVAAIKKSLYDINVEENKANQASARKIKEEGMKSQGEIDKQYVTSEGQMDLAGVNNEAELQSQREENASQERIELNKNKNTGNNKVDRALVQIDKTLRNDYVVKQRTEQAQYANNTLQLLRSANPVSNEAAKTQLARLSGEVGVITDKDAERFGGSKALIDKTKQAITSAINGKLTNENRQFLINVAETFESAAAKSLNERLQDLANGQSEAFEVPMDRIVPLVTAYGSKQVPVGKQDVPKPAIQAPDNNTRVVNGVTFRKVNGGWQRQ